ncbi:MAG: peptidoglycan DD-metalloendopeptidase family protein [Muribaculaceae bacterium]|nr:peptidoglycan DD-metalloendopeptidase family protein [Muribaculaceae bacterium]
MIRKNILHNIRIAMTAVAAVAMIAFSAHAQKSQADVLEGVLAGMGSGSKATSDFDFDNLLNAMEGGTQSAYAAARNRVPRNFKTSSVIDDDVLFANIADAMSAYSGQSNSSPAESAFAQFYGPTRLPSNAVPGGGFKYNVHGGAILPVVGRMTSGFGYRPKFGRNHKGVDIALNVGDTVRAALDGTVERVSNDPNGYGLFVCLRHDNGLETRYAHLSKIIAVPGRRIRTGDPVGLGGSTGNSTGPHLHFETRVNGTAYDPTTMFDFTNPGTKTINRTNSLARLDYGYPSQQEGRGANYTRNSVLNDAYRNQEEATAAAVQAAMPARTTYVVKAGDTVGSVAMKNGISVLTLCRLNMLSSNSTLTPGRMLKVR